MLKPPGFWRLVCCSRFRPLHWNMRGESKGQLRCRAGRRVSDRQLRIATRRPASWISNRVTGNLARALRKLGLFSIRRAHALKARRVHRVQDVASYSGLGRREMVDFRLG